MIIEFSLEKDEKTLDYLHLTKYVRKQDKEGMIISKEPPVVNEFPETSVLSPLVQPRKALNKTIEFPTKNMNYPKVI